MKWMYFRIGNRPKTPSDCTQSGNGITEYTAMVVMTAPTSPHRNHHGNSGIRMSTTRSAISGQ